MLAALTALLPAAGARCQPREQSASDLVRLLTAPSARPDNLLAHGIFDCASAMAEDRADRRLVEALAKMGESAIPDIEAALDSLEVPTAKSGPVLNSGRLLAAYARIRGPAAFPRLRRMLANPRLAFVRPELNRAMAVSLGITSYVPNSGEPGDAASCTGVIEPGYVLDRLILAWEKGDRDWVERSLGPVAEGALRALLKGTTWQGMRAEFWTHRLVGGAVVGYRFMTRGWWSHPPDDQSGIDVSQRNPANPVIETLFTDGAGHGCGTYPVSFVRVDGYYAEYLVDNNDLGGLLRVVARCAASQ